jgi:hypothetical protein
MDNQRQPWEDVPHIFKDEKAYFNWLRSQIRRIWSRAPVKIAYKMSRRYKAPVGKNNKEVFVSDCEMCGKQHRACEVDHLHGGYGFKDWTSFCEWSKMILWVTFDDIRELCPDCHAAVSLSQRLGIDIKSAFIEKEVLIIMKLKASQIDSWLKERNVVVAKNAKSRRDAVRKVLEQEKYNEQAK